jgi:threonine/homoserine/homoserine lactone efflux protein
VRGNVPAGKVKVNKNMDLGIITAVAMLIVWAVLTFVVNDAPGITHALLTAGVALLIWRVVKRSEPKSDIK